MAIKKIVKIWDGQKLLLNNIQFLKQKTKDVKLTNIHSIDTIINDLIDTYQATSCAGIASNQIGYNKRVFIGLKKMTEEIDEQKIEEEEANAEKVARNSNADNYEIYINPKIEKTYTNSNQEGSEGCLSIPNILAFRVRHDKIKIRYYNLKGKKKTKIISGFLSKLFQHELDHLDGKLMIEFDDNLKNIVCDLEDQKEIHKYKQLLDDYYQ